MMSVISAICAAMLLLALPVILLKPSWIVGLKMFVQFILVADSVTEAPSQAPTYESVIISGKGIAVRFS